MFYIFTPSFLLVFVQLCGRYIDIIQTYLKKCSLLGSFSFISYGRTILTANSQGGTFYDHWMKLCYEEWNYLMKNEVHWMKFLKKSFLTYLKKFTKFPFEELQHCVMVLTLFERSMWTGLWSMCAYTPNSDWLRQSDDVTSALIIYKRPPEQHAINSFVFRKPLCLCEHVKFKPACLFVLWSIKAKIASVGLENVSFPEQKRRVGNTTTPIPLPHLSPSPGT